MILTYKGLIIVLFAPLHVKISEECLSVRFEKTVINYPRLKYENFEGEVHSREQSESVSFSVHQLRPFLFLGFGFSVDEGVHFASVRIFPFRRKRRDNRFETFASTNEYRWILLFQIQGEQICSPVKDVRWCIFEDKNRVAAVDSLA